MITALDSAVVAVSNGHAGYGGPPPFSPGSAWPEYPFGASALAETPNPAYEGVRNCLRLLELDASRFDSPEWNPLGDIVRPGDCVLLKPNFVREYRESSPDHGDCLVTHGAIIRAVTDYVFIALGGRGRIIVADAPQNDADFAAIRRICGLDQLQDFYRRRADFEIETFDLRPERADKIDGVIVGHRKLEGDPAGYVKVNLGERSAFTEINHLCHRLYGSEYDTAELRSHQHDDVHEYLICKSVLDADVLISLPKLKTHKKVGLTVNMKNMVGINGNKNWLPHHREGTPAQGGDQFADNGLKHTVERKTMEQFKRWFPLLGPLRHVLAQPAKSFGKLVFGDTSNGTIRSGNWHGNDTTWRMVLDLNRIMLYSDASGVLHDAPQRRFFSVVDGIVAGEGNGPLDATPKRIGVVAAGANPVAVDLTCASLMGFNFRRIPALARAFESHMLPLAVFGSQDVVVRARAQSAERPLAEWEFPAAPFEPHFGWKGNVELQ